MMKRAALATLVLSGLVAVSLPAEARHRRHHHGMHGWCRADAAQMMGIRRAAVVLEPQALRLPDGRYALRGLADHGFYGQRSFTCHFDARGVLQGAV